jgi:hypothetical protein
MAHTQNNKPDEIQPVLKRLALGIREEIPAGFSFALLVFNPNDKTGKLNYISDAPREVVMELLKKFLYRNLTGDTDGKIIELDK